VEHVLRCECGYRASGPEAEVVAAAQAHAWDSHGMELSAELARALVHPRSGETDAKRARRLED
jgi:predicted small metal-binding protein